MRNILHSSIQSQFTHHNLHLLSPQLHNGDNNNNNTKSMGRIQPCCNYCSKDHRCQYTSAFIQFNEVRRRGLNKLSQALHSSNRIQMLVDCESESHLLTHAITHALTHSLSISLLLTHSLTNSLTHSLTHSLNQSINQSITHSLTPTHVRIDIIHILNHTLTHSPAHSLTQLYSNIQTHSIAHRLCLKHQTHIHTRAISKYSCTYKLAQNHERTHSHKHTLSKSR